MKVPAQLNGWRPIYDDKCYQILLRKRGMKYKERNPSEVKKIVVHHSGANNRGPIEIAKYHVKERGWPGIGYHYVIDRAGKIFKTNPIKLVSYHATFANQFTIGICLLGNLDKQFSTKEQMKSLVWLIVHVGQPLHIAAKDVLGHKEINPGHTVCPGKHINMVRIRQILDGDDAPELAIG